MSHLLDDDDDLVPRRERELTLSTGSILGIFFALVMFFGLFFALGYNMGSKAHQPQTTASTTGDPEADNSTFDKFNKPSAGSPAGSTASTPAPSANNTPALTPPPAAANSSAGKSNEPGPETAPAPAPVAPPAAPHAAPLTLTHANAEPMPQTSAGGTFVVQIAAVSHQEDAELLVSSLRGKGYSVAARSEPQDKLIHIQVGPFADKKTAEAMRARLSADGYNAIVK